jgi:hypothetical protein
MSYSVPEEMSDYALAVMGEDGHNTIDWHDSCDFLRDHVRAFTRTFDFLFVGSSLVVFERLAAVRTALRFMQDWEVANQKAQVANVASLSVATYLWNRFQAAPLARAMTVWGMSWQNVKSRFDGAPADQYAWTRKEGGKSISYQSNDSAALAVQLSILTKLPFSVQESEAAAFVDDAAGAMVIACSDVCIHA